MNKKIFFIFQILFIFAVSSIIFAGEWDKSGEYYRYKRDGYYVYNDFVYENQKVYYMDENGYLVTGKFFVLDDDSRYYAQSDGSLYRDGKYKINGKNYYFDSDCKNRIGWIEDIYYANEEGYLVTGFQQLPIPNDWKQEEDKNADNAWFYFNTADCKKVYAGDEAYITKSVSEKKYCFDQNGILRTGWRQIKETDPAMRGYMYFIPEETEKFKFAQAVSNTWYAIDMPYELENDNEVHYFYFNPSGYLNVARSGNRLKVRINQKNYLFNEYGYAVYGVQKIDNEYYYCGNSSTNCSLKSGKFNLYDGSGNKYELYFDEKNDGKGYTGVYNGKLYYKGLLQKASSQSKYSAYKVRGMTYLVNTSGNVAKNKKKIKDGDGVEWSTDSSGIVTYTDGGEVFEPTPPDVTEN